MARRLRESVRSQQVANWGGWLKVAAATALCALAIFAGCSKEADQAVADKSPEWQRGRGVFVANCIACHNGDPAKDGPIGPALKGSSRELIEARVVRGKYPPNYRPKRQTHVMPQFPFLAEEVPYLEAYLR